MGQAYFKQNKHKQALRYLLNSLQAVDTSLAMDDDESSELNTIYKQLSTVFERVNDESLVAINRRFITLLEGKDWKQRVADTRRQLEETMREQGEKGVVDILTAAHGDRLSDSVSLIDRYMRQGLYVLAMDESHRAVEVSPNYLPVHVRMAEIMMREGRVRQAITKYNTIARTFLARGENDRASEILTNVLELAPLDTSVRESLIELLEMEERWDEALDQYIDLADAHHQLGNFDMSRDTYMLAERIATRVDAAPEKLVRIKHRMADIDQLRLDLRRAQKTYEEIIQLSPDDERAHRMLVDLNYRQGNQVEAIRRLDKLLSIYARQKQVNRITQLLEEMVTLYPNDTGLRSRLASIYRQLGRKKDAIIQLDALGELQLEAGLHKDAANTIRQIITMNPEHVEDYQKLLAQLGG
jgi:tetratricopeptide (TPR) repeat protein